jgi:PEP-CTERM motif
MSSIAQRQTAAHFWTWFKALCMTCLLIAGATGVQAMPLLNVSGVGDKGYVIAPDQAAAVSFSFTQAFSGVSITADLTKLDPTSVGAVYLMNDIGPGTTLANQIAAKNFSDISFIGSATALFSGLNLGIGDYALIVVNGQSNAIGKNVIWNGSSAAIATPASGVVDGIDFFSADTSGFLFDSAFATVLPSDRSAFFSVTAADPVVINVPEPGSLVLLVIGLAGIVRVRVGRRGA